MSTKAIAFILLIAHLAILLFIGSIWYKYNRNVYNMGGEMSDTIFAMVLFVPTVYYFALTVWSYRVYQSSHQNKAVVNFQLISIFVLGILSAAYLLYKM